MGKTRIKWRDDRVCAYCFEPLPKFVMYWCSEYCQDAAKRWKEREDSLKEQQDKVKKDLEIHNAERIGDSPEDYIEGN